MSILSSADILTGTQNTEYSPAPRRQGADDAQKGEETGRIDAVLW